MGKRFGWGILAVVAVAVGLFAWQWRPVQAHFAAAKLKAATTLEDRTAAAEQLLTLGEPGVGKLVDVFRSGTSDECAAVSLAVSNHLRDLPAEDPKCGVVLRSFLRASDQFNPAGTAEALDLLPLLSRCDDANTADRCKALVQAGLKSDNKTLAVRLAVRPEYGLKAEVVPLLNDPQADVRRAAMAAVGPPGGAEVIGTEDLFRWLNDADAEVRMLCEAALSTRGLEPEQIDAGKMLTHHDAGERLRLLLSLQRGRGTTFADPGPWLERLSRDPDPAVRAGAARVGYESRLRFGDWLDRLTTDPDPTVARIAAFHKVQADQLKQAGWRE